MSIGLETALRHSTELAKEWHGCVHQDKRLGLDDDSDCILSNTSLNAEIPYELPFLTIHYYGRSPTKMVGQMQRYAMLP